MKKEQTSGGIGLMGTVFIVFLILKLAGIGEVATWSWWWVFAPLWAPAVLIVAILIPVGIFAVIKAKIDLNRIRAQRKKMENDRPSIKPGKKSVFQERLEQMAAQRKFNELNRK